MVVSVVILAAGQGKRMYSKLPKVQHQLAGKPLLEHVIHAIQGALPKVSPVIVYGHGGESVREAFAHYPVKWVQQAEQLGTGHALLQALPEMPEEASALVLYGDVPLISTETLKRLITTTPAGAVGFITAYLPDPTGYGRIQRDASHRVVGVVEEKEATPEEKRIQEINSGIYFLPAAYLKKWLPQLKNTNAQKEYYLTDIIACAVQENKLIHTVNPQVAEEVLGVNEKSQLAYLERFYQYQQAKQLMQQGVTLMDPTRLDIRGEVNVGKDVSIDVNVILEGKVTLGSDCVIGPHVVLRNVVLGDRVEIRAHSLLDGAEVGADSIIGPFARLRPGSVLASKVHIGNFVEVKNSEIGESSKANHLSYIGDSSVGKHVNIGAGTITCNYDGINKHRTVIEDEAFIGSSTQLVAPVTVGRGAFIGAGSTITKNAPPQQLTLTRAKQQTVADWRSRSQK